VKDGKKLVTSRVRLHAGQRQQHMAQWSRRLLNDKLQHEVASELESDPTGIGFAYGGMHPGVLHAKGALFEAHKVSFSVGLVGRYLLHVRLRQHALPLPGSPFTLNVAPGAPAASSTRLPNANSKRSRSPSMIAATARIKSFGRATNRARSNPRSRSVARTSKARPFIFSWCQRRPSSPSPIFSGRD
jgi:hypothetical protein